MENRIHGFHNDIRYDAEGVPGPYNYEKDDNDEHDREQEEEESKERENEEEKEKREEEEQREGEYMEVEGEEEEDDEEELAEEEEDGDEEEELEEEGKGGVNEHLSEPLRKRQKEIVLDRISELPDSLILQILSFLGAEEVGRTSILSKRWRFMWTSVPTLVFSDYKREPTKFVRRVYRALILHKRTCMKRFAVKFLYQRYNAFDIGVWIKLAVESKVEHLCLCLVYFNISSSNYQLPQYLYSNASLRSLQLAYIKVVPNGSVSWTALKRLSIEFVELTQETVRKILCGSPVLEFLRISNFVGVDSFNISSTSLKEIVMQNHCRSHATRSSVEISAPNLQILRVYGHFYERHIRLINVSSLVYADIKFCSLCWLGPILTDKELLHYVKELFLSIRHVKRLEMGSWCIQVFSALAIGRPTQGLQYFPSNLKVLTIESYISISFIPGILGLLQSSPDLETLVIKRECSGLEEILNYSKFSRGVEDNWSSNLWTVNYSLDHLRTVKITGIMYPDDPDDLMLSLLKYLLQNAKVLEKMEIRAGSPFNCSSCLTSLGFVEVAQKLLSLPRSSPKAIIMLSP